MEDWAFTIKFQSKPDCKPSDYYDVVYKVWEGLGCRIVSQVFETDSKGVCHAHGIVSIPKSFYRKRMKIEGVHVFIRELTDRAGWIAYMNKTKRLKPIVPSAQRPSASEGGSNELQLGGPLDCRIYMIRDTTINIS